MATEVKETGIIMSGSHPRDILEGRKTMTRRTWGLEKVNQEPDAWELCPPNVREHWFFQNKVTGDYLQIKCPYGQVGDLLWVKETHYRYGGWALDGFTKTGRPSWKFQPLSNEVKYLDNPPSELCKNRRGIGWWRRPSLFMPKDYARIWRPITGLRAERLQEITPEDCLAEGCHLSGELFLSPYESQKVLLSKYERLWDSLNAKRGYPWEANHWVWPIEFGIMGASRV